MAEPKKKLMQPRTFYGIISIFVAALVISISFNGFYYLQYQQTNQPYQNLLRYVKGITYSTNILFEFGNGTKTWFNNTRVPIGWSLYNATVYLTHGRIDATYYSSFNDYFVTGIEGVQNTQTKFWFTWFYNATSWQTTPLGPLHTPIYNGTMFAWTYCGETASYTPTCAP